jgi:hypothetical protein
MRLLLGICKQPNAEQRGLLYQSRGLALACDQGYLHSVWPLDETPWLWKDRLTSIAWECDVYFFDSKQDQLHYLHPTRSGRSLG